MVGMYVDSISFGVERCTDLFVASCGARVVLVPLGARLGSCDSSQNSRHQNLKEKVHSKTRSGPSVSPASLEQAAIHDVLIIYIRYIETIPYG